MSKTTLLDVQGLTTSFETPTGPFPAVDHISFSVNKGETLCIVGESGCGKSMTALSITGLIPNPPGKITNGKILMEGKDLLELKKEEMRRIRGKDISMIFQEPMTSLNPVFTVGKQIAEILYNHGYKNKNEVMKIVEEMLEKVGITEPKSRMNAYPHQLSGGMRQRIMIAMALACNPKLLIADEPTTALDVTIQAQILELMKGLKDQYETAIILITHDLGVVADMADRVMVMYAGEVVEVADVYSLFKKPFHPYTEGLIKSIPRMDEEVDELSVMEGTIPSPDEQIQGCKFQSRCPYATEICKEKRPNLVDLEENRKVACWHSEKLDLEGVAVPWTEEQV